MLLTFVVMVVIVVVITAAVTVSANLASYIAILWKYNTELCA